MAADETNSFSFRAKSSKSNSTNCPPPFFDATATATAKSSLADLHFDQYPKFVVETFYSVSDDNIPCSLTVRPEQNNEEKIIPSPEEERVSKRSRVDMENLPVHPGMDEYKAMSVETLAQAILAKSGWKKGMWIGKNAKEDIKVVKKEGWAQTYGLGFDPKIHGVSRKRRRDEFAFERCLDSLEELDIGNDNKEGSENSPSRKERSHVQWLRSHIIVQIVSEDFEGGKWYMNKGKVVAVVGSTICDLLMENGEIIQGVDQEILETALPHLGGFIVVLHGRHEGVYGR